MANSNVERSDEFNKLISFVVNGLNKGDSCTEVMEALKDEKVLDEDPALKQAVKDMSEALDGMLNLIEEHANRLQLNTEYFD